MNYRRIRKRMKYHKKKYYIYGILVFLLFLLGIGYSYLNTSLSIGGTSKISSASWDIHFDSTSMNLVSGSVPTLSEPVITGTSVSSSARLENQGDFYSFTIDVVNNGTIGAVLSSISITPTINNNYLKFQVLNLDDTPVTIGENLEAGQKKAIKVLARYIGGLDVDDYPIEDESYNFTVGLDYVQES